MVTMEPIDILSIDEGQLEGPKRKGRPPGSKTQENPKRTAQANIKGAITLVHSGIADVLSDERIRLSDDESKVVAESLTELAEQYGWLERTRFLGPAAAVGRIYDIEAPRVRYIVQDVGKLQKPQRPEPKFNRNPRPVPVPHSVVGDVAEGSPLGAL